MSDEPREPSAASEIAPVAEVARIRLLEERPETRLERTVVGHVTLRREVRTHLEHVEVELTTETLVVRNEGGEGPAVWVNGEALEPGGEVHLVLYCEQPEVGKRVVVREEVRVLKASVHQRQSVPLELGREVLHVETEGEVRVQERSLEPEG